MLSFKVPYKCQKAMRKYHGSFKKPFRVSTRLQCEASMTRSSSPFCGLDYALLDNATDYWWPRLMAKKILIDLINTTVFAKFIKDTRTKFDQHRPWQCKKLWENFGVLKSKKNCINLEKSAWLVGELFEEVLMVVPLRNVVSANDVSLLDPIQHGFDVILGILDVFDANLISSWKLWQTGTQGINKC